MIFIDGDSVHGICDWRRLADALEEAHRGPRPLADYVSIQHETGGLLQTYANIPAWLPGEMMCSKLYTIVPDNPDKPERLPAIQAMVALFDGANGVPLGVLDGTALTYRKTAADSALGSRLLSREDSSVMTMVGAGGLAPYLVRAHRAVRPAIAKVHVWNRRHEKAQSLAAGLRDDGVDAQATQDLEAAVRASDIVSCATASTEPLVLGGWLQAGAHLDLVGAFTPQMRECDDEAVKHARLFVDSRQFAIDKPGDLGDPIARGVISADDVEADLFELCGGAVRVARQPGDITLFKNGGGAHLDLFTARFIWNSHRAAAARCGPDG